MSQTITTHATGSTGSTATARPGGQRRRGTVALWCLQVLCAGVFVMAAIPKVTADPQAVAGFAALGLGTVGMYIIGALELAGALGLLIPRLAGPAGLGLVALMIGAVLSTLLVLGASMVAFPAADPGHRRRSRLPRRHGFTATTVVDLRRRLGLATGFHDLRAGSTGPGPA